MCITKAKARKARGVLDERRRDLLTRYRNTLDNVEEELSTPGHEVIDVANEQWDARVMSHMSDADAHALANVVAAMRRIEHGTYGTCSMCGGRIEEARLAVLPEAEVCYECASAAEELDRDARVA